MTSLAYAAIKKPAFVQSHAANNPLKRWFMILNISIQEHQAKRTP